MVLSRRWPFFGVPYVVRHPTQEFFGVQLRAQETAQASSGMLRVVRRATQEFFGV